MLHRQQPPPEEDNVGGQQATEIDDADLQRFFGVPDSDAENDGAVAPPAAPAAEPILEKQRTWH